MFLVDDCYLKFCHMWFNITSDFIGDSTFEKQNQLQVIEQVVNKFVVHKTSGWQNM
jgi:hypothetical protein